MLACRDFHAGEPGDLFTNQVKLRLETKTTNPTVRDKILEAVKGITAAEWGVYGNNVVSAVNLTPCAPITLNDTKTAQRLQGYFGQHFGDQFWVPTHGCPCEGLLHPWRAVTCAIHVLEIGKY